MSAKKTGYTVYSFSTGVDYVGQLQWPFKWNELNVMLCVPGLSPSHSRERRFSDIMSRLWLRVRDSLAHRVAQILNIFSNNCLIFLMQHAKKIFIIQRRRSLIVDVGVVTKNVPRVIRANCTL